MSTFPTMKTGAVAQYPATRALEFSTQIVHFVDGTEQRFRDYRSPVHKWTIRLDLLDEDELAKIEEFFESAQGSLNSFGFVDPWDGVEYPNCSIESDVLEIEFREAGRGRATIVIRQNVN